MREIRISVIDLGGLSQVRLRQMLQKTDYEYVITERSMLVRASEVTEVPVGLSESDFPPPATTHALPMDPEAWAWLVGSWVTIRIAENLVDDVYEQIKDKLRSIRTERPSAQIEVGTDELKVQSDQGPES